MNRQNTDIKTIVVASRNPHKIEELRAIFSGLNIDIKSALDYPELVEVDEDQLTLEGNALKKARYVHENTGLPVLADDTGLEVDALDGRPGVFSARYAGEDATYEENTRKLLNELAGVDHPARSARFRTIVAFIRSSGEEHTFEGICRGRILKEPRGEKGFGYDPVFQPEGFEQTFAELESSEKNAMSHRGRAIQEFYTWLKTHL